MAKVSGSRLFFLATVCGLLMLGVTTAHGSGFALMEQSVKGLGNAFAGGSAAAEDASTIYFNPAGMTRLQGHNIEAALHIIIPQSEFENQGTTISPAIPVVGGMPIVGGNGGDAGTTGLVPNLYYAVTLNPKVSIGIGINAPFGLETDYNSDWVGRYHALQSEMLTININPAIAYKATPTLSLGAGVSAQYIDADLSNAIDFGLIGAGTIPGFMPQAQDGSVKLSGDDWGYGFNLGVLWEPSPATRFGIAYRSQISAELEGDADFRYPNAAAQALASSPMLNLVDQDISADIDLPDSLSISGVYQVNPKWAVMADVSWTHWSKLDELRIEFDQGAADAVTTLEWDDSWRYSVGASYTPNTDWVVRLGLAYDETPIPGPEFRTPRIPGEDRFWVTGGLTYNFSPNLGVDCAYAHIFVDDPVINKSGLEPEDLFRGALKGEYDASVDIFSFQLSYRF